MSIEERREDNCATIRRMVAERGWTYSVLASAYDRLSPGLATLMEKLELYSQLKQIVTDAPETLIADGVLSSRRYRSRYDTGNF